MEKVSRPDQTLVMAGRGHVFRLWVDVEQHPVRYRSICMGDDQPLDQVNQCICKKQDLTLLISCYSSIHYSCLVFMIRIDLN